ncbi:MAG TPA: chalcone isomerase family protein [Vicinamibacterales bacterium]|jgi:hypothetical protein
MKRWLAAAAFILAAITAVTATEIGGVNLPDRAQVGGSDLVLNGGGIRVKFGLAKVYVAALYVAQKTGDAGAVISAATPRRVHLAMLRDVAADTLQESLIEALKENTSAAEFQGFQPRIKQMSAIFSAAKEAKRGDAILLDLLPGKGTQITVRGQAKDIIAGDDFANALLKIWLGPKPVSPDLKKGLLGGK